MRKEALLLMFLLLTVPLVYAQDAQQDVLGDVTKILTDFAGVIFIIIFVIILLLVAGVFPKGGIGKIPWSSILLIIAIILVFVIPQFIPYPVNLDVPENFKVAAVPDAAVNILVMLGLPREWVAYIPAIIYMFILPFAGIYAIVWSFLATLKVFLNVGSNVNRVLALVITFMTIPVGLYVKMVWVLFSFMGAWSVAVFAVIFIVGVFYRGASVIEAARDTYKATRALGEVAKKFSKYANDKLVELRDAKLIAAKELKKDIESKIYAGIITNEKDAIKTFDDGLKNIEQS